MKRGLQFGKGLAALAVCAALAMPGFAQRGRDNGQQNRPPKQEQKQQRQNQQAEHQQRQQQRQQDRQAQREVQRNANRPPQTNPEPRADRLNRPPGNEPRGSANPNRPPNAFAPPPRTATPQQLRRNEQEFNRLTPQQKQDMRERAQAWRNLSPEQRSRLKNDVIPKWRQLPPDRQRAIQQRLGVLKNMPEFARNQHLNDPNFTRGMSEEDKATLRELSHMHVGGAPEEPPNE